MQSGPNTSGDMSQDSESGALHRTGVPTDTSSGGDLPVPSPPLRPAIDRAARTTKRMYDGLSASSAGLEMGISVALGLGFGTWLDGRLGTRPWMLLLFLVIGMIAGFRGVLRAVARADRAAKADAADEAALAAAGKAAKVSRG